VNAKKGNHGHDEWVIMESLATALIALEAASTATPARPLI